MFNQQEFNKFVEENGVYGFFEEPIKLVSGRMSHFYVNWRDITKDVWLADKLTDYIIEFAKDNNIEVDTFYGVPEAATKLGLLTQYKWAKMSGKLEKGSHALAMGRKVPKDHGMPKDKFFVGMPEGKVVIVEDLVTVATNLMPVIDNLKSAGVDLSAVIVLSDRKEKRDDGMSVKEAVEAKGVKFYSMSSAPELLPIMYEKLQPGEKIGWKVEEYYRQYGIEKIRVIPSKIFDKNSGELNEAGKEAKSKVCLALDNGIETLDELKEMVEELKSAIGIFKIGKENFTKFGPDAFKIIQDTGGEVFFDSKFYDIPNTVKGAAAAATRHGVSMFNVHISGGIEMMKAAIEGAKEASEKYLVPMPRIIGVTVLTSIDQKIMNDEQKVGGDVKEQVLHLARLAEQAGLDGIVCSAEDLEILKKEFPEDFLFITPGIRMPERDNHDQKRVVSPGEAAKNGAGLLVIGRAITAYKTKEERLKAAYEILEDITNCYPEEYRPLAVA